MKKISELRLEIESRSASTTTEDSFGTDLVGRLLSLDEVQLVAGGDGTCYSGTQTHEQTGAGGYIQQGGQFNQTGAASYGMSCT